MVFLDTTKAPWPRSKSNYQRAKQQLKDMVCSSNNTVRGHRYTVTQGWYRQRSRSSRLLYFENFNRKAFFFSKRLNNRWCSTFHRPRLTDKERERECTVQTSPWRRYSRTLAKTHSFSCFTI